MEIEDRIGKFARDFRVYTDTAGKVDYEVLRNGLRMFISQLLSERAFDMWELSYIKSLHLEAMEYRKLVNIRLTKEGKSRSKKFLEKISKLLSEEE